MSKDIDRASTRTVESKYFTSKLVMDESLSDFKEPKKLAAIKPNNKTKPDKPKKAPKRIRGQKDIRSALHSKKNELKSYAKDFETVCQQAGLDIDSEQLQLAIALSKSLQPSTSTSDPETSQQLSSQDRVGKIRTTLLEYGFKVPVIKKTTSRRLTRKKNYKLLLTCEETKNQRIADKFSQILFKNGTSSMCFENTNLDVAHIHLYHLTTSASYSILKSIDSFYVDGLLEKSASTSNLLRDWSEIPGRPVSPKICECSTMNFSEIECSQDELDIVLSGSLKSCRNIINSKEKETLVDLGKKKQILNTKMLIKNKSPNNFLAMVGKDDKTLHISDNESLEKPIVIENQYRSGSPDLFDDEPSVVDEPRLNFSQEKVVPQADNNILDLTKCYQKQILKKNCFIHTCTTISQQSENVTKILNNSLEITSCIDGQYLSTNASNKTTVQLSQDTTKRKSNDCMEITNCVSSTEKSLPIQTDIDLTLSSENQDNTAKIIKPICCVNQEIIDACDEPIIDRGLANKNVDKIEMLTKVTNSQEENNIDITESPEVNDSIESLDLTQSSNTSDELPFVSLKKKLRNSQEISSESADNTIIIDPKDYEGISKLDFKNHDQILNSSLGIQNKETNHLKETVHKVLHAAHDKINYEIDLTQNITTSEQILDLTQDVVMVSRYNSTTSENNTSFFEEFEHNHSNNNDVPEEIDSDVHVSMEYSKEYVTQIYVIPTNTNKGDIDLTLNAEPSEELSLYLRSQNSKTLETMDASLDESDIDLTQNTSTSEDLSQDLPDKDSSSCSHIINVQNENVSNYDSDSTIEMVIKSSQRCSSLGKKDDVSIDYDEFYDRNNHSNSQHSRSLSNSLTEKEPHAPSNEIKHNLSNISNKSKDQSSNCSQDSEVFVISDNELDYSMHQSKLERPVNNFEVGGISIIDDFSDIGSFKRYTNIDDLPASGINIGTAADIIEVENYHLYKTPIKHKRMNELSTPQKASCSGINTIVTPSNHEYVIKTDNVTPMPNYEEMSIEEIHKELDDFGIKPFKRKRAIQLLTHIYNQTHPTIDTHSDESPCKKRKTNDYESPRKSSPRKVTPRMIISPNKPAKSPRKVGKKSKDINKGLAITTNEIVNNNEKSQKGVVSKNHEVFEAPAIKEIECSPSDWVFQKREKAKVHSCRVPLHIAFHNYVSSRRNLREAILCYEPINIDDIHKDLVAYGHRYDPKELLKFMDKKCITVKTTDNDGRNQKL